jgi:hypothetical protein
MQSQARQMLEMTDNKDMKLTAAYKKEGAWWAAVSVS